ncbi:MAG TPA: signal peptidase II [Anaeromyxobacter sp.]|nr:signal peptidase II [Anaeromyxobacter sp.]
MAVSVMAAVVLCDQATKVLARGLLLEGERHSYLGDVLRLELVRNPGAFLSLGAALPPAVRSAIFTWGVAVLVVGAAWVALFRRGPAALTVGAALVAGGGLGNLWDRLLGGGLVIDFLNLGLGSLRTGIFNAADVAILAGVAVLLLPRGTGRA